MVIGLIKAKVSKLNEEKEKRREESENIYNKENSTFTNIVQSKLDLDIFSVEEKKMNDINKNLIYGKEYVVSQDDNQDSLLMNIYPIDTSNRMELLEKDLNKWNLDEFYEEFSQEELKKIWQNPKNWKKFNKTLPTILEKNIQNSVEKTAIYNSGEIEESTGLVNVFYWDRSVQFMKDYVSYFSTKKKSLLSFYRKNDNFPWDTIKRFLKNLFVSLLNFGEYVLSDAIIETMFEHCWVRFTTSRQFKNEFFRFYKHIENFRQFVCSILCLFNEICTEHEEESLLKDVNFILEDEYGEKREILLKHGVQFMSFEEATNQLGYALSIKDYVNFLLDVRTIGLSFDNLLGFLNEIGEHCLQDGQFETYKIPNDHNLYIKTVPVILDGKLYFENYGILFEKYTVEDNKNTSYEKYYPEGTIHIKIKYLHGGLQKYVEYYKSGYKKINILQKSSDTWDVRRKI